MHLRMNLLDAIDTDVLMEQAIQLVRQQLRVKRGIGIEMCSHASGMYPSISTASTSDDDILAQQQGEAALQFALHRHTVRLYLPSVIRGSIVAKPDKISHCGCKITKYLSIGRCQLSII